MRRWSHEGRNERRDGGPLFREGSSDLAQAVALRVRSPTRSRKGTCHPSARIHPSSPMDEPFIPYGRPRHRVGRAHVMARMPPFLERVTASRGGAGPFASSVTASVGGASATDERRHPSWSIGDRLTRRGTPIGMMGIPIIHEPCPRPREGSIPRGEADIHMGQRIQPSSMKDAPMPRSRTPVAPHGHRHAGTRIFPLAWRPVAIWLMDTSKQAEGRSLSRVAATLGGSRFKRNGEKDASLNGKACAITSY
jgi:hypothetical protein